MSDKLRYLAARLAMRLPDALKIRLSGEPPVIVDGQQLDPQVQLLRSVRRKVGGSFGLVEPTVEQGRARYRHETTHYRGPITKVAKVNDLTIGSLRARHYTPFAANAPLTVYLHGGGFAIGDLDTHDEPCRILCAEGATHVLAIDYRLAPEHPFPAALDDAQTALRWAKANARSLGADPTRIAVGGDSAGANLAAVIAREASAQLLIYPVVDSSTRRPSHALFGEGFFLSNRDRDHFDAHYAGPNRDPRVSPLLANDFRGLPPALLVIAGFDILRDEGLAYAGALRAAQSEVLVQTYPSLGHGFIHMTGVAPAARRATIAIAHAWKELLAA